MNFPEDLRYTQEHEWVRVDGTMARVGITDYAQDALGDVVYVDLPEIGAAVAAMASCCEVESTKSVSEIFSPVAGTIAEINSDLSDAPQMINEDPYGKGWIFAVEITDAAEVDGLMNAAAYQAFLGDAP
ncbi:MAG TPA: glycine cleavage system protein GcvH [Acidimicrobiia bacterium]|jgi:glycine cleavage system H protein|nr:glycine cleavage system protein GcvH [Acidimicrobiia bacterium]